MKRLRSFIERRKSNTPVQAGLQEQPDTRIQQNHQGVQQSIQARDQTPIKVPGSTLSIALRNDTNTSPVYAYITGQALDNNNAIYLLQADGRTAYYPTSPSSVGSPLTQDVAIPLGAPGNTVTVQIPHIAGGRIWFSIGNKLTFLLNPGPALVEPSVTNPSDPSINVNWTFCEFTFNSDQLYANISYVDFVSIPVSLNLTTTNSGTQHVSGMPMNGLAQVADGLRAQAAKDGQGWDRLIVTMPNSSQPLRVLSPNQARVGNPGLFENYYAGYVDQVFNKYASQPLSIDTQASYGVLEARTSNSVLYVGNSSFTKPSTSDIFTCSTGPFATGSNAEKNTLIPRVSAAFNRSTLLSTNSIPAPKSLYYQENVTNHYSRVVHEANLDGKGYAFPYDDVQPNLAQDESGKVQAGDPQLFTVAVGGSRASVNGN